ncbi:MAG: TonB-dependent receptor [Pseudomonadota bacterium]|jgi:iron complex outermembrane receptor protein|nr:MAG: TonB-dependent receptor [Pseudomonadota bacterium]
MQDFIHALALRAGVLLLFPAGAVHAAAQGIDRTGAEAGDDELPMLYVYATAIREDANRIASSFSVLDGDALTERAGATVGGVLDGLPGVHADTFGGGAARPGIRGQTAPRITVLSDSSALLDASDISPDHAVTADPMLVERIEVLRGPATLLYGSGAIGGVVNLLDNKVPTTMPDGIEGGVALRGATAARERALAGGVTAPLAPRLAARLEGMARRADDYRARGPEGPRVPGTWAQSGSATAGLSWIGETGYLGLAYSFRDEDYGVPGHSHEYESCHPHEATLHCGGHGEDGDHDHPDHQDADPPGIELRSARLDLRGEWQSPLTVVERIRLRASHTDYRHDERDAGAVTTRFRNQGVEARLELHHAPLRRLRGVAGVQYASTKSRAEGQEAFLPTVSSRATGLFLVEHLEVGDALHLELGARHEWLRHRPVGDPHARPALRSSGASFSGALAWRAMPSGVFTLSVARYERLPHPQELYARGIHLATNTYECGLVPSTFTCGGTGTDAALREEASRNVEAGFRGTLGAFELGMNAFYNHVDNYTHARTLDQFGDFRLVRYTQHDARFVGGEAGITWRPARHWSATLFGDVVRARFAGGEPLPRIPAARHGVRLEAGRGEFGLTLELKRVQAQRRIASFETVTPGHEMLDLTLRQHLAGTGLSWYLRGSNLLDQRVWNHGSFLAHVVPLPRRSLAFGVRLAF